MDDMSVEIQALQAAPFCAGLSPEDIAGIVKVGQPVTFEPGRPWWSRATPETACTSS